MIRQIERHRCGRRWQSAAAHALHDRLDVVAAARMALDDRPLHARRRVPLAQELQDADEVANASGSTVLTFQVDAQFVEDRGQLPVAEDVGVIQRRRLAAEDFQVMKRVEVVLEAGVQARMPGHDLVADHDDDLVDVALYRHGPKGVAARHAVVVAVETHGLILVHLRGLRDAGVERVRRQGQRMVRVASEALADGLGLPGLDAAALGPAAAEQVGVQLSEVLDHRHRCGPVALQVPNAALDTGLLLRPAHEAEQWCKTIMTRQRLIALVRAPLAALEDQCRHRGWVVPPQLTRHRPKEGERLDEAVQDRLRALGRQRNGERAVGVAPGHQKHRHLPAPLGEVHVDVAEVALGTLARIVVQRNEGLHAARRLPANVETHPFLAALVAVFVAKSAKDLGGGVPLLARRLLVRLQDGINRWLERIEDRRPRPARRIWLGLRLPEDLADLAPRVMKPPGQFPDAYLLYRMGMANARVLVHLDDHPSPPCS